MNTFNKILPPHLKICGVTRPEDLDLCERYRVDFIGLNFYRGSKRFVDLALARQIISKASFCQGVGVFVDPDIAEIVQVCRALPQIKTVQLHGRESVEFAQEVRIVTGLNVWKAVTVADESTILDAKRWVGNVETVLLDGSCPGSGQMFDWRLLKGVAFEFGLAGGITDTNIQPALSTGAKLVDIASGAEISTGIKSAEKIAACAQAVKEARQ